jgi:hypothetical protein
MLLANEVNLKECSLYIVHSQFINLKWIVFKYILIFEIKKVFTYPEPWGDRRLEASSKI